MSPGKEFCLMKECGEMTALRTTCLKARVLLFFLFAAASCLAPAAGAARPEDVFVEAATTAKFANKTDRTINPAILSEAATDLCTKGWCKIDPGKPRTLKNDGAPGGWFGDSCDYYAYASKKGAKTVYWRVVNWQAPLNPTENFDVDNHRDGMAMVGFRRIKNWKISNEDNDSTATINFTIN